MDKPMCWIAQRASLRFVHGLPRSLYFLPLCIGIHKVLRLDRSDVPEMGMSRPRDDICNDLYPFHRFVFAVGVMLAYHLYGIAWGETSVEGQDHEEYRRKAKERNEHFVNSYDLGKMKNLEFFFNIDESGYGLMTLFIPLRLNPYTDGFSWARREGYDGHHGVRQGEELTDEDEDGV